MKGFSIPGSRSSHLKVFDNRVARPLLRFLPPLPSREAPEEVKRVLVIRPGGLGDALLLLPFLGAFRKVHPQAEFWVLAEPRNAQAFYLLPFPCRGLCYTEPAHLLAVLGTSFDVVVDTEQWYGLSALVARLVKARFRVGFGTNARARCFNRPVDYAQMEYEAQAFMRLLEPWVEPPFWWDVRLPLFVSRTLSSVSRTDPLSIAIFPGASHPSRRWGKERYLEVARFLVGKGLKVVVVGGPGEKEEGEFIVSSLPLGRAMDATGSGSLKKTADILARCKALVTADSGIMHLAALMDMPVLSLFGPGIVEKWAPRGEGDLVVKLDLPCSPCTRFGTVPPCPYHYACMEDLSTEMVVTALEEFLARLEGG